jgi:membrane protease YdiL (CAAX protease family)
MIDSKLPATTLESPHAKNPVTWQPWLGIVFVILIYYSSQVVGSLIVLIYPTLMHWNSTQASAWLQSSIIAQFAFILSAEVFTVGAVYLFLRKNRAYLSAIGMRRPRWSDLGYGVMAVPFYYLIYLSTVGVVSNLVPSLNVNQAQDVGFNNAHGVAPLILTFISLVILAPLAEEILVRGLLYSSLKKGLPTLAAVLVTSAIFASAHLPEGGAAGPLYIAALDTFVLSLVLIYLREKTGGLWSSITLHSIKNGVAFVALFIVHVH